MVSVKTTSSAPGLGARTVRILPGNILMSWTTAFRSWSPLFLNCHSPEPHITSVCVSSKHFASVVPIGKVLEATVSWEGNRPRTENNPATSPCGGIPEFSPRWPGCPARRCPTRGPTPRKRRRARSRAPSGLPLNSIESSSSAPWLLCRTTKHPRTTIQKGNDPCQLADLVVPLAL